MGHIDSMLQQAIAMHSNGNLHSAKQLYDAILLIDPENADVNNLLGVLSHQEGDAGQAVRLIGKAIAKHPERPSYHLNLGVVHEARGDLAASEACYRQALAIRPDSPDIWYNLGNVAFRQGNFHQAADAFRQVIHYKPRRADAHFNLGNTYVMLSQEEEAKAAYEKAVALEEDFVDAWINLGELYEKTNQLQEAERCVKHLLRVEGKHPAISVQAAKLLRRSGKFAEALAVLEQIPRPVNDLETDIRLHFESGKICDRLGHADQAFDHFRQGKDLQKKTADWSTVEPGRYLDWVRKRQAAIAVAKPLPLDQAEATSAEDTPVFVIGFPRSGTTLVGQILNSHPALQIMEEKPPLGMVVNSLGGLAGEAQGGIASLPPEKIRSLRDLYLQGVKQHVDRRPGSILVDKFPLNIIYLDLMLALFPAAKFVLVIRHPLDVCLSNFMQYYELNDAMANFSSLESAATLYSAVMSAWEKMEEVFHPNVHMIRYEELVDDFERQTRQLLDFLGVGWHPAVQEFSVLASQRQRINTPSYHQVVEPIYKRAKFRWKSQEKHMRHLIPQLEHFIKRFGYQES